MEIDLPPWKIFTKAISLIWEKRLFALYISLPIIMIYMLLGAGVDLGIIEQPPPEVTEKRRLERITQGNLPFSISNLLWGLPAFLLFGFLFSVLAVYWHRSILLGEHSPGKFPLRFDRVVWRYILFGIGMVLWTILLSVVATLIVGFLGFMMLGAGVQIAVLFFGIPLFFYIGILMFRLSLVLPAAAIGYQNFGFGAAWRISRGHSWQFLAIILLMFGLSIVLGFLMLAVLLTVGSPAYVMFASLPKSLTLTLEAVFYAAQTLISIGVLSLSFAYLTYEGPRGGAVTRK